MSDKQVGNNEMEKSDGNIFRNKLCLIEDGNMFEEKNEFLILEGVETYGGCK